MEVILAAAKAASLNCLQGHGICIGATLKYLLCGVLFKVMKVKGHWQSDTFSFYLTHHFQILIPYMQDKPELYNEFVCLIMPQLRR